MFAKRIKSGELQLDAFAISAFEESMQILTQLCCIK
jgi:hypothetical protein